MGLSHLGPAKSSICDTFEPTTSNSSLILWKLQPNTSLHPISRLHRTGGSSHRPSPDALLSTCHTTNLKTSTFPTASPTPSPTTHRIPSITSKMSSVIVQLSSESYIRKVKLVSALPSSRPSPTHLSLARDVSNGSTGQREAFSVSCERFFGGSTFSRAWNYSTASIICFDRTGNAAEEGKFNWREMSTTVGNRMCILGNWAKRNAIWSRFHSGSNFCLRSMGLFLVKIQVSFRLQISSSVITIIQKGTSIVPQVGVLLYIITGFFSFA